MSATTTRFTGRRTLIALFVLSLPLVTPKIRGADEIEYFSYLRSFIFDHDLEFGNEYQHFYDQDPRGLAGFKATFLDRREPTTGRHINFAPMGTAILWSPFYLAVHAVVLAARAVGFNVETDGFSRPYLAAVCYASALYGFLGLLLLHDALTRFGSCPEPAATWSVAALWFGSPLLYYMTIAPGFSHAASVFAVSLLIWLWLRIASRGLIGWREAAALGAAGGLAGLVREQDALVLVVPGLALLLQTVRQRDWLQGLGRAGVMGAVALVAFVPQLLAYHAVNGTYSPSRMVARKMAFGSPHFIDVLVDPAHGLFAWTPLLLLATIGLVAGGLAGKRETTWLLGLGFLLQVWINGSVESWTQAGAFGSRRFVSATPFFVWGLASLLNRWPPRRAVSAWAAALAFFVWWNLSLMVQFGLKLMDRQGLEWPRVAVNQITEVPPRLGRAAFLFLTDRERLVREGP